MKKKLILLILVLPIFLMVSLFAATRTASWAIKVPVSGIEIIGDDIVYLSLDSDERYKVEYAVYPTNAENRNVVFSTEEIDGYDFAELEYKDGYIVPKSTGIAKVYLTTVDGGYRDSFIVEVDSSELQSIECTAQKNTILVGEKTTVNTVFRPANAPDLLLDFKSSDESVAQITAKNEILGVGRGRAVITVSSKSNPDIKDTVEIEVYQKEPIALVKPNLSTSSHNGTVEMSLLDILDYEYSYKAYDSDYNELPPSVFSASFDKSNMADGRVLMNFERLDHSYVGVVRIEIFATYNGTVVTENCTVNFVDEIELSFDKPSFEFFVGQNVLATFSLIPEEADVTYTYTVSNSNIQIITVGDGVIALYANKAGVTSITLRATDNITGDYKEASASIVVKPKSFIIGESAKTFGDENVLAVGGKEFDGSNNKVTLSLSYKESEIGEGFTENLFFVTDNESVLIDRYGRIRIGAGFTGTVNVHGVFKYGDVEYKTASIKLTCVGDGVNVRSFKELYYTVKEGKPVVLQADVIDDFGIIDGKEFYNENTVGKIHTTYDDTYYDNIGKTEDATVKILLEFKNDLYGNGFTINASNVTMKLDETGALMADALFRGPLNFVSMTESAASAVSVKAQDNICFALYDNASVRNVKLYGCTLTADDNGQYEITDLNYVGTTVEVLGDNVSIKYTRIHNGRTNLRVFGHIDDPEREITLDISNSVLGVAREFIIRTGSNHFVDCPATADPNAFTSTRLEGDESSVNFPVQKEYSKMTDEEKAAYDEKFIKTYVNVKNCVFTDAGIFAIGIDSHFSGVYLAQGKDIFSGGAYSSFVSSWYDLAKTSYGAKLTFEGEVRMFNWKNVENVDSSTLIEIVGDSSFATQLEFNVSEMISGIAQNPNFKNIITQKGEERYVHAGIAFFGGGKNYGVFEFKDTDKTQFSELVGYEIGLGDVNKGFLASAAGNEKFYFMLYDSTSQFLPQTQDYYLASQNAYDCIYRAD